MVVHLDHAGVDPRTIQAGCHCWHLLVCWEVSPSHALCRFLTWRQCLHATQAGKSKRGRQAKASDEVSSREWVRLRDWCGLTMLHCDVDFGNPTSFPSHLMSLIASKPKLTCIGIASRSQPTCIGIASGRQLTCIRVPSGRPHHSSILASPDCVSPWLIDCTDGTV